jgi:tetratricopeptide (TPR) repeat protein
MGPFFIIVSAIIFHGSEFRVQDHLFFVLDHLFFVLCSLFSVRWSCPMNDEERRQLHKLLDIERKRLYALEQKAAVYGINVPPEMQIELDKLRTEVAGIEARLAADAALRLPAPVADFVGRMDELARLVAALGVAERGASAAISGVRGLGGLGKTQLALAVARDLAGFFPDGQIMLALRGASADPMTPTLALQTVIRAYKRDTRLPEDLAQLQVRYHALLSGKRLLILADDARDAAQVRPLLPPAGCALLVTSRRRFHLPGIVTLDLGVLPEGQAIELLRSICARVGENAGMLAKLCGHLPLALRISAGVLANDDTLNVARYLARLERERLALLRDPDAGPDDTEANIEASLRLSYDALDAAAQSVLRQLSVFAAGFDLAAAEATLTPSPSPAAGEGSRAGPSSVAIVSLPSPVAAASLPSPVATGEGPGVRALMSLLRRRCLLEWDAARERYSLHELVRAFGAIRLEEAEIVQMRYAQHYAKVASRADDLYLQGGERVLAGLALFDAERAHIDVGWGWARERAGGPDADQLLLDYPNAVFAMADLRYDSRHERIPQLEAQLASARRMGSRDDEGYALGNLGNAYADLGKARRAIEYHEQQLIIVRAIGDRRGEGNALGNLGNAYADLGEARRAIEYHEQQLVIARAIGDRRGEGNALGNLGLAYAALGEARRAIEFYEQSLLIKRAIGDRRGEANSLYSTALALEALGDRAQAISYAEAALPIYEQIESPAAERVRRKLAEWRGGSNGERRKGRKKRKE